MTGRGLAVSLLLLGVAPAETTVLAPAAVTLRAAKTQQFTVTPARSSDVRWKLSPVIGSITAQGLYTAPPLILTHAAVTVTATLPEGPALSAAVQLEAPRPLSFTTQPNGLATLVFDGVDYNYKYGEGLLTSVTHEGAAGAVSSAPKCKSSATASSVTQDCTVNNNPVRLTATYSTPRLDTVCADLQVTNRSGTAIADAFLSTLGIRMREFHLDASHVSTVQMGNPVSWVSYGTGKWVLWSEGTRPDTWVQMTCGWGSICKNQVHLFDIAAGQTKSAKACVRFTGNVAAAAVDVAPEAYSSYRDAHPPVIRWPDRRPIMTWFIAEGTKRSRMNPRGYLQLPTLNAADSWAFRSAALGQASELKRQMDLRPVRPQGIIIWDIDGQEFDQPTSYLGDPRIFDARYAPEMNAAADSIFAIFRNGGYRVGVTLRPQYLQWGTALPEHCRYDPSIYYRDYFVKVDNPFLQRFYGCYDPAGVKWSLMPRGNGAQTFYRPNQIPEVVRLLTSKVKYARSRWGATLFYIDTAVWVEGGPMAAEVFREVQAAFPDSLFIPEQSTADTLSAGIPYSDPRNPYTPIVSPLTWRWIYPAGAMALKMSDCRGPCWTKFSPEFKTGQKIGDIAIYSVPKQMYPEHLTEIENLISQARREMGMLTVMDAGTGEEFAFAGRPGAVDRFPAKLRVYFAPSEERLRDSSLYCEAGQWLGENTCTLDLTGVTVSAVRYYDFTNQLVKEEAPVQLRRRLISRSGPSAP